MIPVTAPHRLKRISTLPRLAPGVYLGETPGPSSPAAHPPRPAAAPSVSVSIVNYDSPDDLHLCLQSLLRTFPETLRGLENIWVLDNNSPSAPDTILRRYPQIHFILYPENVGFGAGNNVIIRRVNAKYHLIVNPDIIFAPHALARMVDYLEKHPEVGLVGPKTFGHDGKIQPTFRRFPSLASFFLRGFFPNSRNRMMRKYLLADLDPNQPHAVDWVVGCCLLVRKEALDAVRGFDERYFMYYEDVDLCYRIRQAGWTIAYCSDALVRHTYRRESARSPFNRMRIIHAASAMRFFIKFLGARKWRTLI